MNALNTFTSQQTFRVLLDALARPGRLAALPSESVHSGMPPTLAVPLALADLTQSVAVVGAETDSRHWENLVQGATNCAIADATDADQVVVVDGATPGLILALRRGDASSPELGCRLVIACDRLGHGEDLNQGPNPYLTGDVVIIELTGPGIEGATTVAVAGVESAVFAALAEANGAFPAGIDTFLVDAAHQVVGIPRSTAVAVVTPDSNEATEGTDPWDM